MSPVITTDTLNLFMSLGWPVSAFELDREPLDVTAFGAVAKTYLVPSWSGTLIISNGIDHHLFTGDVDKIVRDALQFAMRH